MLMHDYQFLSRLYAKENIKDDPTYHMLGLCGEVGEVAEHIKKSIRDEQEFDKELVKKELGDVLWYLAGLADTLGFSLDDIAQTNLAKLDDRYERGMIEGSGDNR